MKKNTLLQAEQRIEMRINVATNTGFTALMMAIIQELLFFSLQIQLFMILAFISDHGNRL